jgi:hypothetical protein
MRFLRALLLAIATYGAIPAIVRESGVKQD